MRREQRLLLHLLLHTGRLLQGQVRDELREVGVPHAQGRVLSVLSRHGPLTQAGLARGMGVTPATTTVMLQSMEERGWVERAVDPATGRAMVVTLTSSGRALAGDVQRAWRRVDRRIRRTMSDDECRSLLPLLEQMRDGLGGHAPAFETYRRER